MRVPFISFIYLVYIVIFVTIIDIDVKWSKMWDAGDGVGCVTFFCRCCRWRCCLVSLSRSNCNFVVCDLIWFVGSRWRLRWYKQHTLYLSTLSHRVIIFDVLMFYFLKSYKVKKKFFFLLVLDLFTIYFSSCCILLQLFYFIVLIIKILNLIFN